MAKERKEKPEGDAPAEETAERSQETTVGNPVVEEPSAEEPARETAVGHPVVEPAADATEADAGATEVFFSRDEPAAAPPSGPGGTSPAAADRQAADASDPFVEKPELFVAGAFVGAFVLGKLLKKLTGSDG